jgi:hypothetical protein
LAIGVILLGGAFEISCWSAEIAGACLEHLEVKAETVGYLHVWVAELGPSSHVGFWNPGHSEEEVRAIRQLSHRCLSKLRGNRLTFPGDGIVHKTVVMTICEE